MKQRSFKDFTPHIIIMKPGFAFGEMLCRAGSKDALEEKSRSCGDFLDHVSK